MKRSRPGPVVSFYLQHHYIISWPGDWLTSFNRYSLHRWLRQSKLKWTAMCR
jgi:hypothetical protein